MKVHNLNVIIREVIASLIKDGYKKKPLCDGTLGSQSSPQFDRFLKGTDLGIKPLERLLDGLGYEAFVIPVQKNDMAMAKWAEDMMSSFTSDIKHQLVNYLENRPISERGPRAGEGKMTSALKGDVQTILDKLDDL